ATRQPARPRSPAPASMKTASSMQSSGRWSATARCASPASGSSTLTAASAWKDSRRRSMADSGNPIPQATSEGNTLRFRDYPVPDGPPVSLDACLDGSNAKSVRIGDGDDVRRLGAVLEHVRVAEIDFPKFRDGRGLSSARILREMGY